MIRNIACLLFAAFVSMSDAQSRPVNFSTHSPEFFEQLLTGRVWISVRPNAEGKEAQRARAQYFHPNGRVYTCYVSGSAYRPFAGNWRVVESRRGYALLNRYRSHRAPDPAKKKGHQPIFYDPNSGALHTEGFSRSRKSWRVVASGWIQEAWPAALRDACPSLGFPGGVIVNEKQTALSIDEMRAQDPDAPIRNFPGSELRRSGGTGIGAAGGGPTMTVDEVRAFFRGTDGMLFHAPVRIDVALVHRPEGDEFWRIRKGQVVDIAVLETAPDGRTITAEWEQSGKKYVYHVGYPIPLLPTGRRYAAFRLMDRLAAREEPVTLPLGNGEAPIRFAANRTAATPTDSGKWWLSRGNLHVDIGGKTAAWPWREVAERAGAADIAAR